MLAILKEDFDSKLDTLKQNLLELENDKRERALNQNKYELEMESIEENWRKDNLQLTQSVNQLRHQNLKLSNTLIDNEKSLSQSLTGLVFAFFFYFLTLFVDFWNRSSKEGTNGNRFRNNFVKRIDQKK